MAQSFGARDLELLLPDNVGEKQTFKTSEQLKKEQEAYEAPKPKIDASRKTRRYFPGKTPDWIPDEEEEIGFTIDGASARPTSRDESDVGDKPVDRRLARLQQSTSAHDGASRSRRRRYEAEVVVEEENASKADEVVEGDVLEGDSSLLQKLEIQKIEEDEEEDVGARRARIKARLLAAAQEEAQAAQTLSAEEKSDSSEYETDSETEDSSSDEEDQRILMKPVFVPRSRRETIREREEKELEAEKIKEQSALLKEETRKHQTRVLVAEGIRREEEKKALLATDADSDNGLPDDADLTDEDEDEYASWKVREWNRIRNEAARREELERERLDLERRRNMTEEERLEEDKRLGKFREKEKKKWKFLQKYYHKGVFYMDESSTGQRVGTSVEQKEEDEKKLDARLRDYSGATLEDNYNKEALPSVLQVKKFGHRGRTKYTHLVDQDTTKFGPEALGKDKNVKESYLQKRSGVGDIDSAGRRKKRRQNH